jgi:hypothetical protein
MHPIVISGEPAGEVEKSLTVRSVRHRVGDADTSLDKLGVTGELIRSHG